MAEPTLKFNNVKNVFNNKSSRTSSSYQVKQFPTGYILYCKLAELPDSLADNALIFTTDTAELFVGTGNGIQRIKLGTEADLNPRLYLKILEAKEIYKNKLEYDREKTELNTTIENNKEELKELIRELEGSVYSKEEIDRLLMEDIDLDGVIDKVNSYTITKIDELLAEKAASVDVYTQEQVNELVAAAKQEASDDNDALKAEVAETYATIADAATKVELADKETEIKDIIAENDSNVRNFITTNYIDKELVDATYAKISQVDELSASVDSRFETVNESVSANASEIEAIKANYVKAEDYASDKESIESSINTVRSNLESFKTEVYKKEDVYTKAEVNAAFEEKLAPINSSISGLEDGKVDKTTYSRNLSEIETAFAKIDDNFDKVYTKNQVDEEITNKVNAAKDYFAEQTQSVEEMSTALNNSISAVEAIAIKAVTPETMNAAIATAIGSKADQLDLDSTNSSVEALGNRVSDLEAIEVYTKDEVYTKAEVDALIESKMAEVINALKDGFRV